MKDTQPKFGTYFYANGDKYWKCVPVESASSSETPYEIRWWKKSSTPAETKNQNSLTVSRKEALRRIEAKIRGGYTLVEEHADDRCGTLLEWFDA